MILRSLSTFTLWEDHCSGKRIVWICVGHSGIEAQQIRLDLPKANLVRFEKNHLRLDLRKQERIWLPSGALSLRVQRAAWGVLSGLQEHLVGKAARPAELQRPRDSANGKNVHINQGARPEFALGIPGLIYLHCSCSFSSFGPWLALFALV